MRKILQNRKFLIICTIILFISIIICIIALINQDKNTNTNTSIPTSSVRTPPTNTNSFESQNANNTISTNLLETQNYTKEYKDYLNKTNEEKAKVNVIPRKEEIPYAELDKIIDNQTSDLNTEKNVEVTIPEQFDLRDIIDLHVGDQGSMGLCWNFASTTCLETNLQLRESKQYDFSEIYVDYMTSNLLSDSGRKVHSGGLFNTYFSFLSDNGGLILEKDLPIREYDENEYIRFPDMEITPITVYKTANFPNYVNDKTENQDETEFIKYQSTLKTHIMNYGSLYTVIAAPKTSAAYVYFNSDEERNDKNFHAVSIIGWDDNFPKENFVSPSGKTPKKDGAYIILNSWGTDSGENGYIYVSYEDYHIHTQISGVISATKEDALTLDDLKNPELASFIKSNYNNFLVDDYYILSYKLPSISNLDLSNCNIKTTNGLELFTNISTLDLSNNPELTNVSNLKLLPNLSTLNLSNNKNITGYENISTLVNLNISNCNITNLDFASTLDQLCILDISGNKNITNFSNANFISITQLIARNCDIRDLSQLPLMPTLYILDLSENKELINFDYLIKNPTLQELILSDCNITDAKILQYNYHFTVLDLSNNKNIKNIQTLTAGVIILKNCNLTNIDEISQLSNLTYSLDLSNNNITDISKLNSLTRLMSLNLSGNTNISLSNLNPSIWNLDVSNCNLDSTSDLSSIGSLDLLDIRNNNLQISDIANNVKFITLLTDSFDLNNKLDTVAFYNSTANLTIKVPSGKPFEFDTTNYFSFFTLDDKTKNFYKDNNSIVCKNGLMENTTIQLQNASDLFPEYFNNCTINITFEIDDTITPYKLTVKHRPFNLYNLIGNELVFLGLVIQDEYQNGITTITNDYNLIYPDELIEGDNIIQVVQNNLSTSFIIYCRDTNKSVTLQLSDISTCNTIMDPSIINPFEILDWNPYTLTIKLTESGANSLTNTYNNFDIEEINNLTDLYQIKYQELFFHYYGTATITEKDIEILKNFPLLSKITIYNHINQNNDNIIVEQDDFEVTFINDAITTNE